MVKNPNWEIPEHDKTDDGDVGDNNADAPGLGEVLASALEQHKMEMDKTEEYEGPLLGDVLVEAEKWRPMTDSDRAAFAGIEYDGWIADRIKIGDGDWMGVIDNTPGGVHVQALNTTTGEVWDWQLGHEGINIVKAQPKQEERKTLSIQNWETMLFLLGQLEKRVDPKKLAIPHPEDVALHKDVKEFLDICQDDRPPPPQERHIDKTGQEHPYGYDAEEELDIVLDECTNDALGDAQSAVNQALVDTLGNLNETLSRKLKGK